MSESVILCEGYHDRAFWKGWLTHLGCTEPGLPGPGKSTRSRILDPWNTLVSKGQYAYHSKSGQFLRVQPCGGKSKVRDAAELRLQERNSKPLIRLVINVDPDVRLGIPSAAVSGLRIQDVLLLAHIFDPSAVINQAGQIDLDGGSHSLGGDRPARTRYANATNP